MGQPSDPGSDPAEYKCPTCSGTGQMESSDSGDESWWDCRRCEGTGKLADRRSVVPAGGLVAEPEAERARADRAEKDRDAWMASYRDGVRGDLDEVLSSLREAEARAEQAEKERDEARFRPGLGDNHHNALACPYCNPKPAERSAVPTATVSDYEVADRGFYGKAVETDYGDTVEIQESSSAEKDAMWLRLRGDAHLEQAPKAHPGIPGGVAPGSLSAHCTLDQARTIRAMLDWWIRSAERRALAEHPRPGDGERG